VGKGRIIKGDRRVEQAEYGLEDRERPMCARAKWSWGLHNSREKGGEIGRKRRLQRGLVEEIMEALSKMPGGNGSLIQSLEGSR